jgi:hypothetical protein
MLEVDPDLKGGGILFFALAHSRTQARE